MLENGKLNKEHIFLNINEMQNAKLKLKIDYPKLRYPDLQLSGRPVPMVWRDKKKQKHF